MGSYLEIINEATTMLIDDEHVDLAMLDSGSATIPGGGAAIGDTFSGGSSYATIAFASEQYLRAECDSDSWVLSKPYGDASAVDVDWLVFDKPAAGNPGFGLQAFDATGAPVFDSFHQYMRVVDVITTYGAHTLPAGPTYAIAFMANAFDRQMTLYDQGSGLYWYDIDKYMAFAKVVGNVVTVQKNRITATYEYREEPVGVLNQSEIEDPAFTLLVLDISDFGAGGVPVDHDVAITDKTIIDEGVLVGLRIAGDGGLASILDTGGGPAYTSYPTGWRDPASSTPVYKCRANDISNPALLASATQDGGSLDPTTWALLGNGSGLGWRDFTVDEGDAVTFTLQFCHEDDESVVIAQAQVVLEAETAVVDHTVSVGNLFDFSEPNGTSDKAMSAVVSNGVGPFTYAWTWVGTHTGLSFVGATNAAGVTVRSTGTNQVTSGTARCTVTDTGNGNHVAADDGEVNITHGTPP